MISIEDESALKKYLVSSEEEYISIFKDWDLQEIEKFINITYGDEDDENFNYDDEDIWNYTKNIDSEFPEKYPCIVILCKDHSFYRTTLDVEILDFLYLDDLNLQVKDS